MKAAHRRVLKALKSGASVWAPYCARQAYIAYAKELRSDYVRVSTLNEMLELGLIEYEEGRHETHPDSHYILPKEKTNEPS
jgi:hypothetical protein